MPADPAVDPKLIRVYDDPADGRYLLGADVVAWLRDLAHTAKDGEVLASLISAPLLDRMADTVESWLGSETSVAAGSAPESEATDG